MTSEEFKAWRKRMGLSIRAAAKALDLSARGAQNYDSGYSGGKNSRAVAIPLTVYYACQWLEHCAKAGKDPDAPA